jgi:hypothetical protein
MRTKLRSKVTLLFIVCAALLAFAGTAMAVVTDTSGTTATSPTIQSDKADYAPGELVTLTGSGWQAGESVNIKVNDTYGASWSRNVDVTANANGEITDSFNLPDRFVSDYDVTATGSQSGTATTTFTDSQPTAVNVSPTSQTVKQGDTSLPYAVLVTMGGSSNACTFTLSTVQLAGDTGLPTGTTANFAPSSITANTGQIVPSTFTVSTANTTPTGTYTFHVKTANASTGCQGGDDFSTQQLTLVVNSGVRNTTTTLERTAGTDTSTYGDSLTFEATVNSSSGSPTAG